MMIITQKEKEMLRFIMTNKKFQVMVKELFIRCRKLNVSFVFITHSYFSVPKEVKLNSTHYLIMKIYNRRELQQIAINHSVDIDYKDFLKVYRYCTKEPYSFLTINTTLPADNHMRFRKNFFIFCFIKMTLTEQVKILDDKIKSNKAQYDLDREAAKISALSSKDLEKYEYLTGEDLGHKPDVIERVKFEYSALGEAFNKVFKKDDKNKIVIKHDNDLVYNSVHNFNKVLMKHHQMTLKLIQ